MRGPILGIFFSRYLNTKGNFLFASRLGRDSYHSTNEIRPPSDLVNLAAGIMYARNHQITHFRLCHTKCLGITLIEILWDQYLALYISTKIYFFWYPSGARQTPIIYTSWDLSINETYIFPHWELGKRTGAGLNLFIYFHISSYQSKNSILQNNFSVLVVPHVVITPDNVRVLSCSFTWTSEEYYPSADRLASPKNISDVRYRTSNDMAENNYIVCTLFLRGYIT